MLRWLAGVPVTSSPPKRMLPGVGPLEAGDHPQRRRLAAAGWAEQRQELAGRHAQR